MTSFLAAWRALDESRHRAELYLSWRAGAGAGFTIPHALEVMGPRGDPTVESLRVALMEATRAGETLSRAVRAAGALLSPFEAGLLALGDDSGRLEAALRQLAELFTRRHRTMLAVRKLMAYPMFLVLVATVLLPLPLVFAGHGRAYPVIVAVGLAFWMLAGGTFVRAVSERYAGVPALVQARLARALASAIDAGLSPLRALHLAAGASGDAGVRAHVAARMRDGVEQRPLSELLAGCPRLTDQFHSTLQTAERTGDFGVLTRLAELYEDGFR